MLYIPTRNRPKRGTAVGRTARRASLPNFGDWAKIKRAVNLKLAVLWNEKLGNKVVVAYSEVQWAKCDRLQVYQLMSYCTQWDIRSIEFSEASYICSVFLRVGINLNFRMYQES